MGDAGAGLQYPDSPDECICPPGAYYDAAPSATYFEADIACPEHGEHTVRPDWDLWAMGIAVAVSARGDCRRSKVGAVLLDTEHRIAGAGYNGSPPGGPSCLRGECPRGRLSYEQRPSTSDYSDCHSLHAELNALIDSGRARAKGGTLYVTRKPCDNCRKVAQAAGVAVVVWQVDSFGILNREVLV